MAVNAASGFEFHYFPFVGGVICQGIAPAPVIPTPEVPEVLPEREEQPIQVCPTCPVAEPCPICQECLIKPCIIKGCIRGCCCNNFHDWDVELYERCNGIDTFIDCVRISGYGHFEFTVPFESFYILKVRLSKNCYKAFWCKPIIILNNVGVDDFMIEGF